MCTEWELQVARKHRRWKKLHKYNKSVADQKTRFAANNKQQYHNTSPTHNRRLISLPRIIEEDESKFLEESLRASHSRSISTSSQSSESVLTNMSGGGGDTWNASANGASEWNGGGNNDDKWNDGGATGDSTFNDADANGFGGDGGFGGGDDQGAGGDGAANDGACHNCGQGK